jgi:transcriptional regulator with XRE-family HTH domain
MPIHPGMDIRALFGLNMRRLRLAAGLSQEAVAEGMGVDRAHVSSMERGQQNVTLLTIWQAAQTLKCRPASLFDEDGAASSRDLPPAVRAPRSKRTKP